MPKYIPKNWESVLCKVMDGRTAVYCDECGASLIAGRHIVTDGREHIFCGRCCPACGEAMRTIRESARAEIREKQESTAAQATASALATGARDRFSGRINFSIGEPVDNLLEQLRAAVHSWSAMFRQYLPGHLEAEFLVVDVADGFEITNAAEPRDYLLVVGAGDHLHLTRLAEVDGIRHIVGVERVRLSRGVAYAQDGQRFGGAEDLAIGLLKMLAGIPTIR